MALDPKSRSTTLIAGSALAILATIVAVLAAPDAASAALQSAAGGKSRRRRLCSLRASSSTAWPTTRSRSAAPFSVLGPDLGRAAVPGRRPARRARARVRRARRRRRAAVQADRRVMRARRTRARSVVAALARRWSSRAGVRSPPAHGAAAIDARRRDQRPESARPAAGLPSPTDLIGEGLRVLLQDVLRDRGEGHAAHRRVAAGRAGLHRPVRLRRAQPAAREHRRSRRGRCSRWCSRSRRCATTRPGSRRRGSYEAVEALTRGGAGGRRAGGLPAGVRGAVGRDELPDLRDHARRRRSAGADEAARRRDGRRASRRSGSGRSRRSSRS